MSQKFFIQSVDIPRRPEFVWAVLADVERWPEWTASISRVAPLTPGGLCVGSQFRIQQPKLPPVRWMVTELRRGQGFTWVSRAPGVRVTASHEVVANGTGSRVTLSIRYEGLLGALLARWTRDLNTRYLTMEAEGLKARCIRSVVETISHQHIKYEHVPIC